MTDTVATPSPTQSAQAQRVAPIRTLMGGTKKLRGAGERYLPRYAAESKAAYDARLLRSVAFNALAKTVSDMTGKVFQKPIILEKDVPAQLRAFAENIDLSGRGINQFARDVFYEALQPGVTYLLVDMPRAVKRTDGTPATLADEQAAGIRPYLTHVHLENLIGWKSQQINGVETLIQVRIRELVSETDGDYAEKEVEQIRVLEPGKWSTWRKSATNGDVWVLQEEGTTSLPVIPLVAIYTRREGFMVGAPPLQELADLNICHWQCQSDLRHLLHTASVPILFGTGLAETDVLEIGASSMVRNSNPAATLQYVEHSGAAIGAGDKNLQNLEAQMQNMGLQLLIPTPGQTATGEIRDNAKENSPLAMMAASLQDGLEQAFGYVAQFIGLGADAGGSIVVNTDFGMATSSTDFQHLLQARVAGEISRQTFWSEMKRRNLLSDSFDEDVERDRLESEAPSLHGPNVFASEHDHQHSEEN